jgi:hypothetical protein
MKIRRWRRYAFATLILIVIAAGAWLFSAPQPRLSQPVYDKLSVGMSLAEIQQLVGVPPKQFVGMTPNFSSIQAKTERRGMGLEMAAGSTMPLLLPGIEAGQTEETHFMWRGPNRALLVAVDANGKVTQLAYGRLTVAPTNWLARCRFWFDSFFEDKD